jgi:hypothetical protein
MVSAAFLGMSKDRLPGSQNNAHGQAPRPFFTLLSDALVQAHLFSTEFHCMLLQLQGIPLEQQLSSAYTSLKRAIPPST